MKLQISDLYRYQGALDRRSFIIWGFLLAAIKYNIDRATSLVLFSKQWLPSDYFFPAVHRPMLALSNGDIRLFLILAAIALPFIFSGVLLTIKRLRSAGLPEILAVVFFVPLINLLLFTLLAILPEKDGSSEPESQRNMSFLARFIPRDKFGSALAGIILGAVLGLLLIVFSVNGLGAYGGGLFLGTPFMIGFFSALLYSFHEQRSLKECFSVATFSVFLVGVLLLALALEGIICIAMAAPIGLVLAWMGGYIGYLIQSRLPRRTISGTTLFSVPVIVPFIILLESVTLTPPPLRSAVSSITVQAPPETVWKHVVGFGELPPPDDWLFKTGIAYPKRARIEGQGVGAIRYCEFSTGAFVEPIEVWDEPTLLRFSVVESPPPMQEWSPYRHIEPPHIEGFFNSKQGQFKLTEIEPGITHLEGTTWYENKIWPRWYWSLYSEFILKRIHTRVLRFIKQRSEGEHIQ